MTKPLPPVYAVHGAGDRWLIVAVDDWTLAAENLARPFRQCP
jgi:hypothetical protein